MVHLLLCWSGVGVGWLVNDSYVATAQRGLYLNIETLRLDRGYEGCVGV